MNPEAPVDDGTKTSPERIEESVETQLVAVLTCNALLLIKLATTTFRFRPTIEDEEEREDVDEDEEQSVTEAPSERRDGELPVDPRDSDAC